MVSCAVLASAGCSEDTAAGYPLQVEHGDPAQYSLMRPLTAFQPMSMPAELPDPVRSLKVPILMYHHVGTIPPNEDSSLRRKLTVSAEAFTMQLDYLSSAGYTPITQAQLFRALFYGDPLPPNPVVLTFDDGYIDSYQQALPVLAQHDFPATFYILTGKVGILGYMDWQHITDLDRQGMDIGAHTVSHRDLTQIPPEEARAEIEQSVTALSEHISHPVYWFSYPSGKYNETVMTIVWQSGFLLSVGTLPGDIQNSNLPYGLYRYRIEADTSMDEFVQLLQ